MPPSDINNATTRIKNRIKEANTNTIYDDQSIMDELNSTCVLCLAEDRSINHNLFLPIEKVYNSQPSMMFKYHIGMCFLIFLSISLVIFISDLKK